MYPVTTEIIENSRNDEPDRRPFTFRYHLDQRILKLGLEGLSQTSVVATLSDVGSMTLFFKKSNPLIKDNVDCISLLSESTDHLNRTKLPKGTLCKTYDLSQQADIVALSDILSLIANHHQNEVVLSGGGKRIYSGINNLAESEHAVKALDHSSAKGRSIQSGSLSL
jgi:hypothetical protein